MFDLLAQIPYIGSLLATVIPFVIALCTVVFIHEFGHYIVGRWCGIQAEAFSLGFGPVLFSRMDKQGTKWQISAIPLGGYVRFLGDADAASRPSATGVSQDLSHKTLNGAKLYKRALTVLAGPASNFILSIVIYGAIAYSTGMHSSEAVIGKLTPMPAGMSQLHKDDRILAINNHKVEKFADIVDFSSTLDGNSPITYTVERDGQKLDVMGPYISPALVGWVMPVSPASKAGLKEGDVILAANGIALHSFGQLVKTIQASDKSTIDLKVWRDGTYMHVAITPEYRDVPVNQTDFKKQMMIGVSNGFSFAPPTVEISALKAVDLGVKNTYFIFNSSINGLYQIATGRVAAKNLQGPVGIARIFGDTASVGFVAFLESIAYISTAIGFLNLMPIPVLDGGHLVMYAFEAVFRRPPGAKAIQVAMTMGLMLLLSLMVFSTVNDISRLF